MSLLAHLTNRTKRRKDNNKARKKEDKKKWKMT